jgi:TadE-like protein
MLLKTPKQRQHRSETGGTVVEAALILPLFLLLIFGIIETSLFIYDINAIRGGARQAARAASVSANDAFADYNALTTSRQSLANMANKIDGMVIFRAPTAKSTVPPECISALDTGLDGVDTPTAQCNVYNVAKYWNADQLNFGFDAGSNPDPTLWDRFWAPTGRNDAMTETASPDFVGVWVRVIHHSATGVIPTKPLTASFVFQIEPQRAL